MEPRQPPVRSTVLEHRRSAESHVRPDVERPPRRRRSALLGGGVLIASSPVAVGAGLFVVGFAALGVGGLLLLLPPRPQGESGHGRWLRVVRAAAASTGRSALALMRGTARRGATAGAAGWSAVRIRAPKVTRRLAATTRSLGRGARSASIRSWARVEPILRRAWAACLAGLARAGEELAPLARSAAERVSAYVDSRCRPR